MVPGRPGPAQASPRRAISGHGQSKLPPVTDGPPSWSTSLAGHGLAAPADVGEPGRPGAGPAFDRREASASDQTSRAGRIKPQPGYEVTGKAESRID
jgi:hypothetical protein